MHLDNLQTHKLKRETVSPPSIDEVLRDNFDMTRLLGSYEKLYLGHSCDSNTRSNGSAGGVGTALLKHVLLENLVDGVVGVGFHETNPALPIYKTVFRPELVDTLSGSKYVYMSAVDLKKEVTAYADKRLAVVVQPCFVPLIRRWQKKNPNIKYVFSFFCGYNKDIEATKYLVKKSGISHPSINHIEYRGGNYPGGFRVTSKTGKTIQFGKENYELVDLMFLRKECHHCPYYMGEFADIALGDAWLKDHSNMTAIISRNHIGTELLLSCVEKNKISLYSLQAQDLVKMHWHNLKYKKYGHGLLLKALVHFFRDIVPHPLVPFVFLGKVSKARRKFKMGISIGPLTPVKMDE